MSDNLRAVRLNAALYRIEAGMTQMPDDAAIVCAAYRANAERLEEAERDTKRLDWLDRECGLYVETDLGQDAFAMVEFRPAAATSSLRNAIDLAERHAALAQHSVPREPREEAE